eukprot:5700062-Pyramimonas_sp.AAC.1
MFQVFETSDLRVRYEPVPVGRYLVRSRQSWIRSSRRRRPCTHREGLGEGGRRLLTEEGCSSGGAGLVSIG